MHLCNYRVTFTWLFLNIIANGVANAGEGPPEASPKGDYVMQVSRLAAHYREVQDSLRSKDEGTRTEALEGAIRDSDPAIRALAIKSYLTRFKDLTPEIVLETGGSLSPENVPQMGIDAVEWSEDGKSFTGNAAIHCRNDGHWGVSGQISGGKLILRYAALCLPAGYVSKDDGSTKLGSELVPTACTATLSPNDQDNELDGPLRCLSIATVAKAKLPFGE